MAKFTKELAKLFRKITNSEIDAEGNAHVVLSPADSLLINNARIALASLEAEAVGEVIEQQSGMMLDGLVISEKPTYRNIKGIHNMKMMPLGTKFYTAPPAPVVPAPTSNSSSAFEDFWSNFEHPFAEDDELKSFASEIYRAAMLQGAEPVTTAYKLRDAVEIIRNSGIEIDAEKIFAERDALNTPDCWCRTCRPVTVTDMRFVVCPDCGNKRCPHANDHRNACTGSNEPGQDGSAYPAAPQQEVTQALAKGMERYGDAMQKLADSGD
ncbi:hypothetical protein [Citrobacter portucalensis]|uniref:hypothetical protein n=1 Tax=Citrobacter portucalensis TaxID=1639133 RepID=UPI001F260559|nr:hypothetical protein [Citrobacter portucalensis]MCE9893834.1 hypothetical protein [Citrobacter portucalensis]